jgi:hypothetical protein
MRGKRKNEKAKEAVAKLQFCNEPKVRRNFLKKHV